MTLLQFLRTRRGLTGTKEGCASGDCGACTVIVAKENSKAPFFQAVNSCICPLGSVHNQHVITVEGLGGDSVKETAHPVQEAMVHCDGSQCGFCTPGFVMSLAALHIRAQSAAECNVSREAVLDAISGNLCRCTGYRPIVEAGLRAMETPLDITRFAQYQGNAAPESGNLLDGWQGEGYWRPNSETELQAILSEYPDACLVAGGTDLMLESTQKFQRLPRIIDLSRVDSLKHMTVTENAIELGAAVTYTELENALSEELPELIYMLERLGSRQIRNSGTVGGNIGNASPIADMPPFLLVMDAQLVIRDSRGNRRDEALCDFYRDYRNTTLGKDEYIASVRFRRVGPGQQLRLYKLSKRYEDDISAVMGAFLMEAHGDMKIAFGGMAAIPARAWKAEAAIDGTGGPLGHDSSAALETACTILRDEFSPISDVRASAAYRSEMACNLLRKAWECFDVPGRAGYPEEELFHHDNIQ